MKGIEAALIQSIEAARRWNVEREVLHSLQHTYPGMTWATLVQSCRRARVAKHGKRRAEEMLEAGEMLRELGLDPGLCRAIAAAQAQGRQAMTSVHHDTGASSRRPAALRPSRAGMRHPLPRVRARGPVPLRAGSALHARGCPQGGALLPCTRTWASPAR